MVKEVNLAISWGCTFGGWWTGIGAESSCFVFWMAAAYAVMGLREGNSWNSPTGGNILE